MSAAQLHGWVVQVGFGVLDQPQLHIVCYDCVLHWLCTMLHNASFHSAILLWMFIVFGRDCWFANLKLCDHRESIFLTNFLPTLLLIKLRPVHSFTLV